MARPKQISLPQIGREGCVTIRLHIDTDRSSEDRLHRGWLIALSAMAVANDCLRGTSVHGIRQLHAMRALDQYFEQIDLLLG